MSLEKELFLREGAMMGLTQEIRGQSGIEDEVEAVVTELSEDDNGRVRVDLYVRPAGAGPEGSMRFVGLVLKGQPGKDLASTVREMARRREELEQKVGRDPRVRIIQATGYGEIPVVHQGPGFGYLGTTREGKDFEQE